jgi:hypothetical protein
MTPLEALLELLERVEAGGDGTAVVSEAELSRWPAEAVRQLKAQKLLVRASPAWSVVCPGCEQECMMPVCASKRRTDTTILFVVCDKRDDINRVRLTEAHLRQWRCGVEAVRAFVARGLGLRSGQQKMSSGVWELGVLRGRKRSQMVCLRTGEALELVVGERALPLGEFVTFGPESYSIDVEVVRGLVDEATTGDPRYTPSVARREVRKLDTLALHESWQTEYQALKKRRPEMSDVWYSQQIAKMDIASGRSAETIRKHMK